MPSAHRGTGAVMMAVFLAGCGTSDAAGRDMSPQVTSIADSTIASIEPIVLPNGDEEPSVTFPAGVVLLRGGQVALIDQYSQRLHIFDITGQHIASGGGKGAGPGQLQNAWGVVPAGGDSIAVWDAGQRRLSIFDDSARFVRVERTSFDDSVFVQRRLIGRLGDGRFAFLEQEFPAGSPEADGSGRITRLRRVVRAGTDGNAAIIELPPAHTAYAAAENGIQMVNVPMGQLREVAVCERGVVVLLDSVITVYDAALRSIATLPDQGESTVLRGRDRMDEIDRSLSHQPTKHRARDRAMIDRLQPPVLVQRNRRVLDADGHFWQSLVSPVGKRGSRLQQRSTLAGTILDTVNTPGADWPFAADDQVSVSLRMERDTIDAATLLFRLPRKKVVRDESPSLGRCNPLADY